MATTTELPIVHDSAIPPRNVGNRLEILGYLLNPVSEAKPAKIVAQRLMGI